MGEVTEEFLAAVCTGVHAPADAHRIGLLRAWQQVEGGTAEFNPFNTELRAIGSWAYNEAGVQNYPSAGTGIWATVATLNQPNMAGIVVALREGGAAAFGAAVDASPWGTRGLAGYLAEHPPPNDPTAPAGPADTPTDRLPMIREGAGMPPRAANEWVRYAQTLLNGRGAHLATDGRFGPLTNEATRGFQTNQGIAVDGIIGPITWGHLRG